MSKEEIQRTIKSLCYICCCTEWHKKYLLLGKLCQRLAKLLTLHLTEVCGKIIRKIKLKTSNTNASAKKKCQREKIENISLLLLLLIWFSCGEILVQFKHLSFTSRTLRYCYITFLIIIFVVKVHFVHTYVYVQVEFISASSLYS